MLYLSGIVAANDRGLVSSAQVDPRQPYFSSSIGAQMDHLIDVAETIFAEAGTWLANVVRIQQLRRLQSNTREW